MRNLRVPYDLCRDGFTAPVSPQLAGGESILDFPFTQGMYLREEPLIADLDADGVDDGVALLDCVFGNTPFPNVIVVLADWVAISPPRAEFLNGLTSSVTLSAWIRGST